MAKPRKEINLDKTKVVKEVKKILREGPRCNKCPNRVSRCTCPGA